MKAQAERQRRASLPAMNIGLFKTNHAPTSSQQRSGVDAFRLYQEEQALSSEDRISFFKKQMLGRRGALTQTAATTVTVTKGKEILEETESEDERSSEEEWEA